MKKMKNTILTIENRNKMEWRTSRETSICVLSSCEKCVYLGGGGGGASGRVIIAIDVPPMPRAILMIMFLKCLAIKLRRLEPLSLSLFLLISSEPR